ncbi:MAG: mtDNA inheritance, partitioning of the mitochondrial organelle [Bogoriella megaspora]|nr:MAG: mtDNA inheritance, partitioning of the mitochondrial organelle [Bogoriella megaspora]
MHEIVTLQFGQQSNYLATHFWNAQESYFPYGGQEESLVEHDVQFRAGIGADGSDTYTPRTLVYDLKGAFGSLKKINALYDATHEDPLSQALWHGAPIPHKQTPISPSSYQQHLDAGVEPPPLSTSSVRYWSDYNRVFYHPRSIVQIAEYELQSQLVPFEKWDVGEELFINLDREHDLLDRDLRPFAEECDQMQGLQIIADADDAWGGFAARYIEKIRDEYGKMSIWAWGLVEGNDATREKQSQRLVNSAKSLYEIAQQASVYIPLTNKPSLLPSYVSIDPLSKWHASALQATALESMTLPARLRPTAESRISLSDLEFAFSNHGSRRVASLGLSVADPNVVSDKVGVDNLDNLDIDLLPSSPQGPQRLGSRSHIFGRAESLRGAWQSQEKIQQENTEHRSRFHSGPLVQRYQTTQLFPQLSSFPNIYSSLSATATPSSLAVRTSLSTSSAVADRIRAISGAVRRMVAIDEREAIYNGLEELCEEYTEGWSSGSEMDEDD